MPITVSCACGKELRFADKFAGRRARCPACRKHLLVPDEARLEPALDPKGSPSPSPEPVVAHATARLFSADRTVTVFAGLAAVVVVGIFIALLAYLRANTPTRPPAEAPRTVALTEAEQPEEPSAAPQPPIPPPGADPVIPDPALGARIRAVLSPPATQPADAAPLPELPPDKLFAQASPAVVRIVVRDSQGKAIGAGSGFFVSADGLLVTNFHVIEDGHSASVVLPTTASFVVRGVVAFDREYDLAILKIAGQDLPHLKLAVGEPPKVGVKVYAIGNPEGLINSLSDGLVSGLRKIRGELAFIQTTAPISRGSSGGPLMTADGLVVGVTTAYLAEGQNLNLAVPAGRVKRLLERPGGLLTFAEAASGWTPLHEASRKGDLEEVKRLISPGQDVNAKDNDGWTPLHWAARDGHMAVVEALIRAKADVNARNHTNSTPLHLAVGSGDRATVEALIRARADVNARNDFGWTPVHWAAIEGAVPVVEALIRARADLKAKDRHGQSPLHTAALMGVMGVVEALIRARADVDARDNIGTTPLHWAARGDVVEALIGAGANVNAKDEFGETPLHRNARQGQRQPVEVLIAAGADVNARDNNSMTPFRLAAGWGHKDVAELLWRHGGR